MIPPFPKCSTHGVHHTPGKNCQLSPDDQKRVDDYDDYIEKDRPTWGQLKLGPRPEYHPIELEKSLELRKKIQAQERKRLEQERNDHQGD
jgi:hypothetical protein